MDRDIIQKIEDLKTKTDETPCYSQLLSAISKDEPINGLTEEETDILRKAYGTTRNNK